MTFKSTVIQKIEAPAITKLDQVQPVYANQYTGEWLNVQLGAKVDRRFYKPKQEFYRPGGRAIILGNGTSRQRWSLARLNKSNKLKRLEHYNILYGCNRVFEEEGELDFITLTHRFLAKDLPKELHKITYTTPEIQRVHEDMDLMPVNHRLDAGSAAAMIACFHGASKVFLFGFDGHENNQNNNIYADTEFYDSSDATISDEKWQKNLRMVMLAYPKTKFYRVDVHPASARELLALPNYSVIPFVDFVSLADL